MSPLPKVFAITLNCALNFFGKLENSFVKNTQKILKNCIVTLSLKEKYRYVPEKVRMGKMLQRMLPRMLRKNMSGLFIPVKKKTKGMSRFPAKQKV